MSRANEIIAIVYTGRHCTVQGCRKCIARARWNRRKKRQSRKSPIPPHFRKEVTHP
jgi:hypothetical protein